MQFKNWLLVEFPVTKFQRLGRWSPKAPGYGFHKDDIGILNSPKGEAKIIKKWSNSKENFELYFVRVPGGYSTLEEGEVTPEWVKERLGVDIEPNLGAITIIYTNNRAAQREPLTAWIIAHRFGHAIDKTAEFRHFRQMIDEDIRTMAHSLYGLSRPVSIPWYSEDQSREDARRYEKVLLGLMHSIGDFKSARENNIRNSDEFVHELLAQYITTGKITFRPPASKIVTRYAYGQPNRIVHPKSQHDIDSWYGELKAAISKYEDTLDQIMGNLVGRMFLV